MLLEGPMTAPADYIKHFTHLNRAHGPVWTEATMPQGSAQADPAQ
jgi:hypothetical protein